MTLYLELLTEFDDHHIIEIRTIVRDNYLWHTVPTDQVMPDKPRHNVFGHSSKRGSFNLLCEVIDGHQDEAMPIGSGRSDFPDHVNAPHYKRPQSSHDI